MAAIYEYNGKLIQAMDLKKKLKKMKLSEQDVKILWEGEANQSELENRFNAYNKESKIIHNDIPQGCRKYIVYSDTVPPERIAEYSELNDIPYGKYKVLIIDDNGNFVNYIGYEKTEVLN